MIDKQSEEHTEADRAIDVTLAALRHATPRIGMEARLYEALQQRQTPASFWERLLPAAPPRPALAGVGALVLFAVAGTFVWHTRHAAPAAVAVLRSSPLPLAAAYAKQASGMQQSAPRRVGKLKPPSDAAGPTKPDRAFPVASLVNHPPPPEPLTEQERLLLRLAHRGEPVEMAALDDAQSRLLDFQAETAQFNDFFYIHSSETTHDEDK